jgi:hypothetical protein
MADYKQSAIYKVRHWMIQEMADNGIGDVKVIPIQQVPEVESDSEFAGAGLAKDAPFIVYDVLIPSGYETDFWNCRDEVMLWIYDYDIERIFEIKEFLYNLFGRFDLSAADINDFDEDTPFKFHYFDVMMGLPTDEIDQVLGRYGMNMVITYQYTRPITGRGRFA